uniref:Cyclin K n=1 Tax=Hypotaenidia okinawae TaxID=2861861 RepID=A0A6G1R6Z2_9GRUI
MKENKENSSPSVNLANLDHTKPCWYWDKKDLAHTPSQLEGLDPATEARYRREGARFIFDVGTRLGLYPFSWYQMSLSRDFQNKMYKKWPYVPSYLFRYFFSNVH